MRTKFFLAVAFLLAGCITATAQFFFPFVSFGQSYSGPGDVLPAATAWYGLRGYSNAYANPGTNPAATVRRASDSTTSIINILPNGNFDIATANTFAGVHATCTGTAVGTTNLALTGCTATPQTGDTLTSTGGTGAFTQPAYIISCGAFGGGAGNCTMNSNQTVTGVTVSAQWGLYVSSLNDQSGNAPNLSQVVAGTQPELLPHCQNGYPCLLFSGAQRLVGPAGTTIGRTGSCGSTGSATFTSAVAKRTGNFGILQNILENCESAVNKWGNALRFEAVAATAGVYAGGAGPATAVAADNTIHVVQSFVPASGDATVYVDGIATTGPAGNSGVCCGGATGGTGLGGVTAGSGNDQFLTGIIIEAGNWAQPITAVKAANLCANENKYWSLGLSCAATTATAYTGVTGPCDLTACAEAWSVTRAMTTSYTGPLFQLYNGVTTLDIGQNPTTRSADMTTWSAFCGGVAANCKFSRIYGQILSNGAGRNDLVPNTFNGGGCTATIFGCATTFAIEAATGLPIMNVTGTAGQEYTVNNYNASCCGGSSTSTDFPLSGINTGTASHTISYTGRFTAPTTPCCGNWGLAHFWGSLTASGSDFMLDASYNNACASFPTGIGSAFSSTALAMSPDDEAHCYSNFGTVGAFATLGNIDFVEIGDHTFTPVPAVDIYYNGGALFQHSPTINAIDLTSGPYLHFGGGGDLSQPAPTIFREGWIVNNVVSHDVRTSIFSNTMSFYSALTFSANTYAGPGDVVAGASAWYGLRAYTAAYAAPGTNPAITVRRGTDNATTDVAINKDGVLDTYAANSFAGIDVSCTGGTTPGVSTTLNLTGCSGTPNADDVVYSFRGASGASLVSPAYIVACGVFVAGNGSCTLNAAQNLTANQPVYALNPLFVTKIYDQSGNGHDMAQAVAINQPQLLPMCDYQLPCLRFFGNQWLTATCGPSGLPYYTSAVAERTGNTLAAQDVFDSCSSGAANNTLGFNNAANRAKLASGATLPAIANDNVLHELQGATPLAGNSTLIVDNASTTGAAGNTWFTGAGASIGADPAGGSPFTGFWQQSGNWSGTLAAGQITNLCHNDSNNWFLVAGVPLSC